MKTIEFRKRVAKEAYKRFIGKPVNLNAQNVAKAQAFCDGAKFATQPDCNMN